MIRSRNASRSTTGSNYWDKSNIKAWLNSSANANLVDWLGYLSPSAARVLVNGTAVNPYDTEKGFLANVLYWIHVKLKN